MARKQLNIPRWFTVVSWAALVWNLLGVAAYVLQSVLVTPELLVGMSEAERALIENTPSWVDAAFAVAVFGGALGSFFLIIRSALAVPLFAISLVGVVVQMFHLFVMSKALEIHGTAGTVMPVLVSVVAVYLLMVAGQARHQGWIT